MSSNRLIYDKAIYANNLKQSVGPFDYQLYTGKYNNSAKCRLELGPLSTYGVSNTTGNLVDLETDLRIGQNSKIQFDNKSFDKYENLENVEGCQMVRYKPTILPKNFEINKC